MKITELFLKYGLASFFGVTRLLHEENERLHLRVERLEEKIEYLSESQYAPSGYPDLDGERDSEWAEVQRYVDSTKPVENEIFGQTVRPGNMRRTVDDLMKEAKNKHDEMYRDRALKEAMEQEKLVDEMTDGIQNDIPVEVLVSDAKQRFLIEAGKTIMGKAE